MVHFFHVSINKSFNFSFIYKKAIYLIIVKKVNRDNERY